MPYNLSDTYLRGNMSNPQGNGIELVIKLLSFV